MLHIFMTPEYTHLSHQCLRQIKEEKERSKPQLKKTGALSSQNLPLFSLKEETATRPRGTVNQSHMAKACLQNPSSDMTETTPANTENGRKISPINHRRGRERKQMRVSKEGTCARFR
ncbi:hypothetical protein AMTRI_Chr03g139380 [Amborella trichopoda]